MTSKNLLCGLLALSMFSAVAAASKPGKHDAAAPVPVQRAMTDDEMRVEGEKRFQANCSRCHQSPHKFPPRMMLTIERHMRVRALITDEDLRLIVRYMTQ
jgi:cytochrome c5